jgi:hypothetical protein
MPNPALWLAAAAYLVAMPLVVQGQGGMPSGDGVPGAATLCFRGAPQARCEKFVLTEFGVGFGPIASDRRPPANAVWEVGAMRNFHPSRAAGGTVFIVYDDENRLLLGLKPRFRHWMSSRTSLDVAPGIVVTNLSAGRMPLHTPGFSGHVALTTGDLLSLFAQAEVLHIPGTPQSNPDLVGTRSTVFLGVRTGSYLGVVTGSVAASVFRFFALLN